MILKVISLWKQPETNEQIQTQLNLNFLALKDRPLERWALADSEISTGITKNLSPL